MLAATALLLAAAAPANFPVKYVATAGQVLEIGNRAARAGDRPMAEAAYRALLSDGSPDVRAEARFRLARLIAPSGRQKEAAMLLRQVVDEHPRATAARLELARLLDGMGDKDGAWRELRAVQASGLPPEVARMVDRYSEALRAARPSGATVQIALAPDSNINKSTRSDTLDTVLGDFEIDQDSKAKSGLGLSLSGQAYRRIPLGHSDHFMLGRISGLADLYGHSDFNDITVDAAIGPELHLGRKRLNIEAGATQRWYGMQPYVRSARLSASLITPLDRRTQVQLSATVSLADYKSNDLQDGKNVFVRGKVERALSPTMGVGFNLSGSRTSARDPGYSTTDFRAGLIGWRDVGRATLTLEAEIGRLHADERLLLLPDKRADKYSRLTFGATFRQLSFGGFAPTARFVIERNKSSVEFYDYSRRRTEFGLVRAF